MKIVRYRRDSATGFGILSGDTIEVLGGSPFEGIAKTGQTVGIDDVQLLAPVQPPGILAIGLNYRKHAEETNATLPDHPLLFIKAHTAATGPDTAIELPAMAPDEVDFEAELVIVIGKKARNVSVEDAGDYIMGYTCGNDVSARDCQLRLDGQWARGKSFDTFAPLGPWIVTELDADNCGICSRLNGKVMQESNTSDLIFNCRQLVSFLSGCMTLQPGTVIFTGTPSGVGFARDPQVFLRPGDVIEIEVEGIGVLKNNVVAEEA